MNEQLIKITKVDLKFITGEEFTRLEDLARFNSFCNTCNKEETETEMVAYEIYLNDLNDVLFKGECKSCKGKMARYIELENKNYHMKTQYIKDKRLKE